MASSLDTIFALASGTGGRAAIAVVRLSGPAAGEALQALLRGGLPVPRRASLRRLHDGAGEVLDEALVLWLPGPASFTREDCAELHLHGGLAVRSAVLSALGALPRLRLAEPGEFTRRAFLSGRLDLSAVEGLADLVDAETEAQRRQALRQMQGGLAERVAGWKERLLDDLALLEASLDFHDEEDIPELALEALIARLDTIRREIDETLAGAARGERIREGYLVVIAGPPNAGKSTLLNAIARRDVAIVSPVPGTTRDVIEVRCDLDGLPVMLADTAGLRDTADAIERLGVERARTRMADADAVLWLHPAGEGAEAPPELPCPVIQVATKADLVGSGSDTRGVLPVSALSGEGVPDLLRRIAEILSDGASPEPALATRERHRAALREASECLVRARAALHNESTELAAEDVRLSLRAIGRIVGAVDVEDVLDRVFAQFCIGK